MDLIDDVDPLADIGRGVNGFVPQCTDLIHAVVGSGVQLQYVQKAAAFDSYAGRALAAGISIYRMLTVDSLGQDFGAGGFSRAAGTGEEIGMGRTSFCYLLFSVSVIWDCPMTSENVLGRHLRYSAWYMDFSLPEHAEDLS